MLTMLQYLSSFRSIINASKRANIVVLGLFNLLPLVFLFFGAEELSQFLGAVGCLESLVIEALEARMNI